MRNGGYFRSPTIRGDTIVFVSEDDLWTVPASGGVARRLTANLGPVGRASLSPDGSLCAFTGSEEAHPEVYVMPSDGGSATRLTYLGANSGVRGWGPDGRIVFVSDYGSPFGSARLYAISPEGGSPDRIEIGPANDISYGPDGRSVIGRNTADPARWKRYRGGTRGELWVDPRGNGSYRRLVDLDGNVSSPMWIGSRIFFLSDHEGIGNIYSVRPDGTDLERHTDHDTYYARFAGDDGERIVYQHAAEIWICEPATGRNERVEVEFHSDRVRRNRRFVQADRYLDGADLHREGHSVVVTTRGRIFSMPLWEQAVRQYGAPDGVRYRLARWLRDGESIVALSDEGGTEAIEVHRPGGERRRLEGLDLGRVLTMKVSPTRDQVAVTNHRLELVLVDLGSATARVLDASASNSPGPIDWSPDGRWIAYSWQPHNEARMLRLVEVETGAVHDLTRPDFNDRNPVFDPDGRYLYFLSERNHEPVYDSLYFDIGFPRSARPYAITLRADDPSPFLAQPRGFGSSADPEEADPEAKEKKKKSKDDGSPPQVRIDLDGIADRVVPFPVAVGRYGQIAAIAGKALFTKYPIEPANPDWSADDEEKGSLEVYDLTEQKHDTLVGGVGWFTLSGDRSTLLYASGERLRALKAGDKPPEEKDESPGRRSGWLDLGRIRVSVLPGAEYRQMFSEAWRLQKDHYWVEDLSGVDWDAVRDRYLPLVDKVATRLEFSDLMWEMLGELGTSHAYEFGGDHTPPPPYRIGHLGADIARDDRTGRWSVSHIVAGDTWKPEHDSPLRAPGVNVRPGDTILAVGGRPVTRDVGPLQLLVNQAGTDVELTVGDPRGRKPRTVVVRTLASETPARYREWVERNRALVHDQSGGRLGYVHVPDMSAAGYAEFHRYYAVEVEREGLIVDVRYNGGGHVSQLLLEKLGRKILGWDIPRWGRPDPYPAYSPRGPIVCLTNEQAGSDGDIFTHAFKLMELGPVVGKRTWGGVVGISPKHRFVDGGLTTQPEFAYWFRDVGFAVENYGTDPDHDVDIKPQDHAAGRDPQMETAIKLAMKALRGHRPVVPDLTKRRMLPLPVLPPRETNGSRSRRRARR
ncbi:MAG TPA: PDZ domain-containing protein [Actinomycetota bacterium]|nr:PDZ domain-containing protein [Actinomycetota bacterium]